jgi:outer membrane lipoprotein SlyB
VGIGVGPALGLAVGNIVGDGDGAAVGPAEGAAVGSVVGCEVGSTVGSGVSAKLLITRRKSMPKNKFILFVTPSFTSTSSLRKAASIST